MAAVMATLELEPLRTLVSLAGILVSASVTILLWRLGRTRKGLIYRTLSTHLLGVHQELAGHVQLLFDGSPVGDVGLVLATIKNSGNQSIKREDFEEPLRLSLSGTAKIISAEVTARNPPDLPVRIYLVAKSSMSDQIPAVVSENSQEIEIAPLMMNSGDWMTIKLLISDFLESELVVNGRILGIPEIRERERTPLRTKHVVGLFLNMFGVSALVMFSHPARPWSTLVVASLCMMPFFSWPYIIEFVDFYVARKLKSRRRRRLRREGSPIEAFKANSSQQVGR